MTDALEVDARFPSGEWTGFFLQPPATSRSWMQLRITFQDGTLRGEGSDWVGQFTMDGGYELKEGRCWWTKRYVGRHEVSYSGYNEGKGIWGVWEIPPRGKGGFHIWPAGMSDPTQQSLAESEQPPADAVSPRTMTRRTFIGG
jgi:hypothetical protein